MDLETRISPEMRVKA
jgi:hypothetical protein